MNYLIQKFFTGSERTMVVKKNILGSFGIKGLSILTSLILVPFTIQLLNQEKYGIWMTIFSIVSWFNMMDIGIGNGFRNKFAEAVAVNNKNLAREYVQTFYSSMGIIATGFFVLFTLINPFLNWHAILNLPNDFNENISFIVWTVFGLFCLQLYLKNISTLLLSIQKTTYSNALLLYANIGALFLIFILQQLGLISLFSIAVAFMISPIIVFFTSTVLAFTGSLKQYKPVLFSLPSRKYFKDLVGLGLKFFFIQITAIVMYSASNLIITQLYGPADVTPYNVAFRLYSSVQVVFSIIVTPFWSAFTEANAINDHTWIKRSINKLMLVWALFSIGVFGLWLVSPFIFRMWVGSDVIITSSLSLQFALFVVINSWTSIFSFFVAGIGRITVSLYGAVIQLIVNIPLAILLAKYLNLNTTGVILATNINLMIPALLLAWQTKKIINNNAYGIWNK